MIYCNIFSRKLKTNFVPRKVWPNSLLRSNNMSVLCSLIKILNFVVIFYEQLKIKITLRNQ